VTADEIDVRRPGSRITVRYAGGPAMAATVKIGKAYQPTVGLVGTNLLGSESGLDLPSASRSAPRSIPCAHRCRRSSGYWVDHDRDRQRLSVIMLE